MGEHPNLKLLRPSSTGTITPNARSASDIRTVYSPVPLDHQPALHDAQAHYVVPSQDVDAHPHLTSKPHTLQVIFLNLNPAPSYRATSASVDASMIVVTGCPFRQILIHERFVACGPNLSGASCRNACHPSPLMGCNTDFVTCRFITMIKHMCCIQLSMDII